MGMLWKRLNDHGKNWRHVYKVYYTLSISYTVHVHVSSIKMVILPYKE